jgi:AcrR family transcriptional regulator
MTDSDAEETTEEAIMQATYRALSKHGYPAMSISKIDDEFEKSKALLYHHYEDKEDLLEHFLKYLLDQLDEDFASIETSDPIEDLHAILDRLLPPDIDEEQMGFQRALLEIRSQAPHNDDFDRQIRRSDELVLSELTSVIERGIDSGQFQDIDPDDTAEFIYTTAYGVIERGTSLEDRAIMSRGRRYIDEYIESSVLSTSANWSDD